MTNSNELQIGDRIKYYRKKAGVGQQELAKRINIYRTTLANYETNRTVPTLATIQLIADALSIPFHKIANKMTNPFEPEESTSQHQRDLLALRKTIVEIQNEYYAERERLMKDLRECQKLIAEYSMLTSRYQVKYGPLKDDESNDQS